MQNKYLIIAGSVIAIFAFLIVAYKLTNTPQITNYPEVNKIKATDHLKWSPEKKNILVEYSDLQCPACKSFHNLIKQEIESSKSANFDITKKVTFIFRHFPLTQLHKNAEKAAYAAESSAIQGKFYEFSDILFQKQIEWADKSDPTDYFVEAAKKLNLDSEKFKKDMQSGTVKNKVSNDVISGQKADVNATPTFYLNGQKLDNIQSFEDFIKLLKNL